MSIFPKFKSNLNVKASLFLRTDLMRNEEGRDKDLRFPCLLRLLNIAKYNFKADGEYKEINMAVRNALPTGKGIDYLCSVIWDSQHPEHPSLIREVSEKIVSELGEKISEKNNYGKLRAREYSNSRRALCQ